MQVSFLVATHNIRCTSMLDVCRLEFTLFFDAKSDVQKYTKFNNLR